MPLKKYPVSSCYFCSYSHRVKLQLGPTNRSKELTTQSYYSKYSTRKILKMMKQSEVGVVLEKHFYFR